MLLSERSQPEKATLSMILSVGHPGKGQTMERAKISGFQGSGRTEG